MLNLQEMRKIKNFDVFNKDKENVFIFPNADSLASHIVKSLLFRLENLDKKSYIIIEDVGKVDNKDVKAGIYIEEDIGKRRGEVLSERFGGSFSTEVINAFNNFEITRHLKNRTTGVGNVFLIDTNKKTNINTSYVDRLVQSTTENNQMYMNLYVIEAFYNGEDTVVQMIVGRDGVKYGVDPEMLQRNVGFSLSEQYIRNSVTSQLVFNLVNKIVTEGMSFNYTALVGNSKRGEINKTYLKGRRTDSIFVKLGMHDISTEDNESYNFDDDYCTYREENQDRITRKVHNLTVQYGNTTGLGVESHVLGYLNLLVKGRVSIMSESELQYKKYIKEVARLIGERHQVGDMELHIMVGYIEEKVGGLYGA